MAKITPVAALRLEGEQAADALESFSKYLEMARVTARFISHGGSGVRTDAAGHALTAMAIAPSQTEFDEAQSLFRRLSKGADQRQLAALVSQLTELCVPRAGEIRQEVMMMP